MGENEIEKAAANLIKLKNIVINKEPSPMMILTNTELAYQRNDGIYVVSLGVFKP